MNNYRVKWLKIFTKGHLEGLSYDSSLTFATLEAATDYMAFLMDHTEKPVKSLGGCDYTAHVIRLETN